MRNVFTNDCFSLRVKCLVLGLFSVACQPDAIVMEEVPEVPLESIVNITPDGTERYLTDNAGYIFDQNQLRNYELIIPEIATLDKDPAAEKYVEGMLIFEGDTISPIGVRYKGSIGAFAGCLSGINFLDPSGAKTCSKLSMKVKINWDDSPYRFFGLNKLQFHSMNQDDSQLRERLAYYFYREMGVPAPRSVHATLSINGRFAGLFALVEQIDGRFVKYNYENDDGNLYKEIWPSSYGNSTWTSPDYAAALKTNEEISNVDLMLQFQNEIRLANSYDMKVLVEKWMDVREIISLAVIDRTIKADDGPFHWYCNGGACDNHNYYWYEDPVEAKMHLIPWDMDNTFENLLPPRNPVTPIKDDWGQISNNCAPFSYGDFFFTQKSAACDKLIQAWTLYDQLYLEIEREFKEGLLAIENTDTLIDTWKSQIRDATSLADQQFNDAVSIAKWESAIEHLKNELAVARN